MALLLTGAKCDPNSSYGENTRFAGTIFHILIRENSEKNDWPLKFQSVLGLALGHLWTKFGPNPSILTRVMVMTSVSRAQFSSF